MRAAESDHDTIIRLDRVAKSFGKIKVLDVQEMTFRAGRIYGLLGPNGSGKSTLVKILSGYHSPDPRSSGRIRGETIKWPLRDRRGGIAVVPQDKGLCGSVSILENFLAVRRKGRSIFGGIRWRSEQESAAEALAVVGLTCSPKTLLGELTVAEQALVAVARTLEEIRRSDVGDPLLILDEPTANLSARDVETVFGVVRRLAEAGAAVVLVNHRLAEVRAICDEVLVLRDGRQQLSGGLSQLGDEQIVEAMFGYDARQKPARVSRKITRSQASHPVAKIVKSGDRLDGGFSAEIQPGEVVGICGLAGMAQDRLPTQIARGDLGRGLGIEVDGRAVGRGSGAARSAGIVVVPADRALDALWLSGTIVENVSITALPRTRLGFMARHRLANVARGAVQPWQVVAPSVHAQLRTLSGGNQQKVSMARAELIPRWRLLVVHEPTQGVDISTRGELLRRLRLLASANRGILVCGSDFDALADVCNRVVVIRRARSAVSIGEGALTEAALAQAAMSG